MTNKAWADRSYRLLCIPHPLPSLSSLPKPTVVSNKPNVTAGSIQHWVFLEDREKKKSGTEVLKALGRGRTALGGMEAVCSWISCLVLLHNTGVLLQVCSSCAPHRLWEIKCCKEISGFPLRPLVKPKLYFFAFCCHLSFLFKYIPENDWPCRLLLDWISERCQGGLWYQTVKCRGYEEG